MEDYPALQYSPSTNHRISLLFKKPRFTVTVRIGQLSSTALAMGFHPHTLIKTFNNPTPVRWSMKRRAFLTTVAGAGLVSLTGCTGDTADGPHGTTPNNREETAYDYNKENFVIQTAFISRNAPNQVGVSTRIISEQFSGSEVPVELKVLDENGEVVFHQPVKYAEIAGGDATIVTAWFEATEEEFYMDLYPKVRFRDEPPK